MKFVIITKHAVCSDQKKHACTLLTFVVVRTFLLSGSVRHALACARNMVYIISTASRVRLNLEVYLITRIEKIIKVCLPFLTTYF